MKFSKAIFIDVDGTLLDGKHQITKETSNSIQQLVEQNYLVVLTTARPPDAVFFIAKELGIDHFPIICLNGALIYKQEKMIFEKGISIEQAIQLVQEMPSNFTLNFLAKRNWYVNRIDEFVTREMQITGMNAEEIQVEVLLNDLKKSNRNIHKILCIAEADKINDLENKLNQPLFSILNIYPSKPTYLEITHHLSSKNLAMKWILNRFEIRLTDVVAIGDGFNDKEMINEAGLGIAMGNAPNAIKASASFISKSNNKNGFSYALKSLNII